jgi:hypothetical protein
MSNLDAMQNKEILALTRRVIELENKRTGDKAATDTLIERVGVLEGARKIQQQLNAQFGAPDPVGVGEIEEEDKPPFWMRWFK